jgi:hypothetical protein
MSASPIARVPGTRAKLLPLALAALAILLPRGARAQTAQDVELAVCQSMGGSYSASGTPRCRVSRYFRICMQSTDSPACNTQLGPIVCSPCGQVLASPPVSDSDSDKPDCWKIMIEAC